MSTTTTRRAFLGTAALIPTTALLAACSTSSGTSKSSGGNVSLNWWDRVADEVGDAIKAALKKYSAGHSGVTIKRTTYGSPDAILKAVIQAAASGTLPNAYLIDQQYTGTLAAQKIAGDVTNRFSKWGDKGQFYPGALDSAKLGDKVYGVPFQTTTTGLFYNLDMFKAAGLTKPPATWDELREYAKKLTTGGHTGFSFSANSDANGAFTFLPFLWQSGSTLKTVGDSGSVATLTLYKDLIFVDKSVSKNVLSLNQGDVSDQFLAGKCAMMINGSWNLQPYADKPPKFKWAVAPWPKGAEEASVLGGQNLMLSGDDKVSASWDLLTWLSQPKNSADILHAGPLPARKDALADKYWKSLPGAETFADKILPVARSSAFGKNQAKIYQALIDMYQKVLVKNVSPQTAATEAGKQLKPLL